MKYIRDYKGENVKDLLEYFFFPYTKTTYKDEDCKILDVIGSKRRSFLAVIELVNTYYPGTSEKEILKTLRQINRSRKDKKIFGHYCNDVGGIVFTSMAADIHEEKVKINHIACGYNYYGFNGWKKSEVNNMCRDGHYSVNQVRKLLVGL